MKDERPSEVMVQLSQEQARVMRRRLARAGINPQGPLVVPRKAPPFKVGDAIQFEQRSGLTTSPFFTVAKAKADGRLRLIWSGWHPKVGDRLRCGGHCFRVQGAGARTINLTPISREEWDSETDWAKNPKPGLAAQHLEATRAQMAALASEVQTGTAVSPRDAYPITPKSLGQSIDRICRAIGEPTRSQIARRARKEARRRGLESNRWANRIQNEKDRTAASLRRMTANAAPGSLGDRARSNAK